MSFLFSFVQVVLSLYFISHVTRNVYIQVGCNTGYKLQELKKMEYLTGFLHISNLENAVDAREANLKEKEMIKKLVYEWSSSNLNLQDEDAKQVLEDLQPHPMVQDIQICHYRSSEFPIWIRYGKYENLGSIYLIIAQGSKSSLLASYPTSENSVSKTCQK